jgi:hypothetical protein
MRFHQSFRADESFLYTCYSLTASGGRGALSNSEPYGSSTARIPTMPWTPTPRPTPT